MIDEHRIARIDDKLAIEAYHFIGMQQKFPNHFHDFYVIGLIDSGKRKMVCQNNHYLIIPNDLILFNPYDNHTCEQIEQYKLNYRSIHISIERMQTLTQEIIGQTYLPKFTQPVIYQYSEADNFRQLHQMLITAEGELAKDECFYFFIEQLIRHYESTVTANNIQTQPIIKQICDYLDVNYQQKISLDDLSQLAKLNKYSLLRTFTKQKGITPYQYLETIRINAAKKRLEQGQALLDIALSTGFTDQSHFSRYFKQLVGLTPKQYQDIFLDL